MVTEFKIGDTVSHSEYGTIEITSVEQEMDEFGVEKDKDGDFIISTLSIVAETIHFATLEGESKQESVQKFCEHTLIEK